MQENSDSIEGFTQLFPLTDLPPGKARAKQVGEYFVGIFNVDGTLYAVDDTCPHEDGPLHSGPVDAAEKTVTCPLHHWCFSLETGLLSNGRRRVATFDVIVSEGNVYVNPTPRPPAA